jgi:hypothetical protein
VSETVFSNGTDRTFRNDDGSIVPPDGYEGGENIRTTSAFLEFFGARDGQARIVSKVIARISPYSPVGAEVFPRQRIPEGRRQEPC